MTQRIKFKYFENKQTFDQNTCDPSDLCFIGDSKEIITHNTSYSWVEWSVLEATTNVVGGGKLVLSDNKLFYTADNKQFMVS